MALVSSHWKAHLPVCGCCWIKVHVCFICSAQSHLVNSQNPWSLRSTTCRGPFTVHTSLTHATLPLTTQKVTVPKCTNKEMVKFYLAHHLTNQIKGFTSTSRVGSAAIFRFWHKSLTQWAAHIALTVMWCTTVQLNKHHPWTCMGNYMLYHTQNQENWPSTVLFHFLYSEGTWRNKLLWKLSHLGWLIFEILNLKVCIIWPKSPPS
jgi:hypothetical protein